MLFRCHSCGFWCHSGGFLQIPVPFLRILVESGGITGFRMESVGHQKVQFKTVINQITVDFGSSSLIPPPPPPCSHRLKWTRTACDRRHGCPSPLLRDVGPGIPLPQQRQQRPEARSQLLSPLPFPFLKGCGQLRHTRRRIRGGRKTPSPRGGLRNTSHDIRRGLYSTSIG